jgi:outer membrane protein assembly factor BamB
LVIVGSKDGNVYAFTESGTREWVFPTQRAVESSPVVANGIVYIGSDDGNLYAINAARGGGQRLYSAGSSVEDRPAVSGGLIYFGSYDHSLYAVTTNQVKRWSVPTRGEVDSSPVLANGTVYFGSDDGNVYAVNALTGPLETGLATVPGGSGAWQPSARRPLRLLGPPLSHTDLTPVPLN